MWSVSRELNPKNLCVCEHALQVTGQDSFLTAGWVQPFGSHRTALRVPAHRHRRPSTTVPVRDRCFPLGLLFSTPLCPPARMPRAKRGEKRVPDGGSYLEKRLEKSALMSRWGLGMIPAFRYTQSNLRNLRAGHQTRASAPRLPLPGGGFERRDWGATTWSRRFPSPYGPPSPKSGR